MSSSFQSIILQLQSFWASHGCLIAQPYYTQVGAGTMNPATFLRVLGPEPWNVAYVEPSVRPDDGRYGENPNRFQQHTQFQVILKPDPGNPVELYLQSLEAIGIDPRQHDIRLVEDNWQQPAISAWGLGWEVWLDGQEITQFTYFQQVGGQSLDPVAVEITYGLERILIALNNAKAIWDETWGADVTYGEIRRREEYEHSKYYFEAADVARLRGMFDLFKAEAEACLARGLVTPAYDYVLKCSHNFNVLDTRGAIGVTERQAFFGQMRDLARRVAETWLEQRKELEYPLLKESQTSKVESRVSTGRLTFDLRPADFLLEIGVEELPAGDLDSALAQLRERVPVLLDELRLVHGDLRVHGTPRRLAVFVENLAPRQSDREEAVKGPPADKAIVGQIGNLTYTPAAQGFAKKNGVNVEDLEIREQDGGRYVFAVVKQPGRPALEALAEVLPGLVAGIKFDKSMRWNDSGVAFSRPIRWLVCLFGETVIPIEYAGLTAGRVTRGLRPYNSPEIEIPSADRYFEIIKKNDIILDLEERKTLIAEGVRKLAASVKGEAIMPAELLAEVANLVEKPMPLLGSFAEEFLALPKDVLISVMEKHQRYFPVERVGATLAVAQGQGQALSLQPHFIVIRNGDEQGLDLVRQGNEHVIGARFADADFFVREDLKHKLEDFRPRLGTLTFQKKLGSMLDKSGRMVELAAGIADMLGLDDVQRSNVQRATFLAKADLMTKMVVEMTSLQGVMGREYALRSGENQAVAEAIGEQYQPVPKTKAGLVVALADRLDSLVGLFAAGLAPTGAKDPFGLRRAALGVVQPLIEHDIAFDLRTALKEAAALEPVEVSGVVQSQLLEFITGRLRALLIDAGYKYDVVDAILAAQGHDPARASRAVRQLSAWVSRDDWHTILPAYARCVRITRDQKETFAVKPEAFVEQAEKDLFAAVKRQKVISTGDVDTFLSVVVDIIPAINIFFDKVLVMAEEKAIRENRLGLLQQIAAFADSVADMSKLEGF
ncbi:MAG: glycine--tRNA ligase subunit beta [Chloroflexi bacterium]|nr:glycine--tRNA ligase subunit beta [Chloroflexota bacterium]